MGWIWRYETADGSTVHEVPALGQVGAFPSQADAEAWLGDTWAELLASGVDQVTLLEEDREVYGPMSLHPAS
jgi:hypothetical protein